MKCSKCKFTTFDGYEFCPRCNSDFSQIQKKLSIIPYIVNENNNYLLDIDKDIKEEPVLTDDHETIEETVQSEENIKEEHSDKEENLDNLLDTTTVSDSSEEDTISLEDINMEVEHNKVDESSDDDSISLDDIDLGDLLETNRED